MWFAFPICAVRCVYTQFEGENNYVVLHKRYTHTHTLDETMILFCCWLLPFTAFINWSAVKRAIAVEREKFVVLYSSSMRLPLFGCQHTLARISCLHISTRCMERAYTFDMKMPSRSWEMEEKLLRINSNQMEVDAAFLFSLRIQLNSTPSKHKFATVNWNICRTRAPWVLLMFEWFALCGTLSCGKRFAHTRCRACV